MGHHAADVAAKRQFIEIRVAEPLTLASMAAYLTDANTLASKHGLRAFLVDVRGFATTMHPLEMIPTADRLKTGGLPVGTRIVLLASPDDASHDFIETAAQNRGLDLRCFKAEDDASAWLSTRGGFPNYVVSTRADRRCGGGIIMVPGLRDQHGVALEAHLQNGTTEPSHTEVHSHERVEP